MEVLRPQCARKIKALTRRSAYQKPRYFIIFLSAIGKGGEIGALSSTVKMKIHACLHDGISICHMEDYCSEIPNLAHALKFSPLFSCSSGFPAACSWNGLSTQCILLYVRGFLDRKVIFL